MAAASDSFDSQQSQDEREEAEPSFKGFRPMTPCSKAEEFQWSPWTKSPAEVSDGEGSCDETAFEIKTDVVEKANFAFSFFPEQESALSKKYPNNQRDVTRVNPPDPTSSTTSNNSGSFTFNSNSLRTFQQRRASNPFKPPFVNQPPGLTNASASTAVSSKGPFNSRPGPFKPPVPAGAAVVQVPNDRQNRKRQAVDKETLKQRPVNLLGAPAPAPKLRRYGSDLHNSSSFL